MDYQNEMQKSFLEEVEQIRKMALRSYDLLNKKEIFKAKIQLILTLQCISDLENVIEEDIKIEAYDGKSN